MDHNLTLRLSNIRMLEKAPLSCLLTDTKLLTRKVDSKKTVQKKCLSSQSENQAHAQLHGCQIPKISR